MSKFRNIAELPHEEFIPPDLCLSLLDQLEELKVKLHAMEASGSVLESKQASPPAIVHSARTGSKEVLLMTIRARADRLKFLPPELFADPAWDMLLDLYLADIMSRRVSVSSLCSASNVPATTALRWIGHLTKEGLIERMSDPCDGRRYFIALSKPGLAQMDGYFDALAQRVSSRAH